MSGRLFGEKGNAGCSSGDPSVSQSPASPGSHKFRPKFLQALDIRRRKHRSGSKSPNGGSSVSDDEVSQVGLERQATPPAFLGGDEHSTQRQQVDSSVSPFSLSPETLGVSAEIWNAAYDKLGQTNGEVRTIYEKILSSELSGSIAQITLQTTNLLINCEPAIRMGRMRDATSSALAKVQRHEVLETRLVDGADFVKGFCDFIGKFVGDYPPAAMALSGVATVLPFLIMPLQADRDMAEGLKHVLERIDWYMGWGQVLLRDAQRSDSDFQVWREKLKSRVTTLYAGLLAFQMKCVCRCYAEHPVTFCLKVWLGSLNWKSELATLKLLEDSTVSDMQTYNNHLGTEFLRSVCLSSKELSVQLDRHFQQETQARIGREKDKRELYQSKLTGRFKTTPYDERMEINNMHVEGTCEWFCSHEAFRRWLVADSGRVLLVSADPGCGKSVLATHMIKNILPKESPNATICYFFFKDNPEQSDLSNAYSAILHNIFLQNGALADLCKHTIEASGGSMVQQAASLWNIFVEAVKSNVAGPIICVLDALDECSTAGLKTLVSNLKTFYSTFWGMNVVVDVRFLLTTRGYPSILDEFKSLEAHYVQLAGENAREVKAIQKEVDLVVNHRLYELSAKKGFDAAQTEKVRKCLKRHGAEQRTYLWAKLIFEVLECEYPENNDKWEDLVNNMPRTVSAAYAKLLQRVRVDQKERVMTLIHIILAAYRPLSLREMNIALMVRDHPGADSVDDLNMASDKSFRKWIIATCGFFVTEYGDKVYLIHQTAKEFLLGTTSKDQKAPFLRSVDEAASIAENEDIWRPTVSLPAAHATLAESCVSYLSLRTYRSGQARELIKECFLAQEQVGTDFDLSLHRIFHYQGSNLDNTHDLHPFCEYATHFWPAHFRHGQIFEDGALVSDIQAKYWPHYSRVFEDFAENRHPGLLLTLSEQDSNEIWSNLDSANTFQQAGRRSKSFTNALEMTKEGSTGALQYARSFSTAALAAFWGHLRILQETVGTVALPEMPSRNAWLQKFGIKPWLDYRPIMNIDHLPILCAVIGNSTACLEYLISQEFPVNYRHLGGLTLLHWASRMGYSDVVSCLLDHSAAIDAIDDSGLTPLLLTLDNIDGPLEITKREAVARLLVCRKASLIAIDDKGNNALHLTVGHAWKHTGLGLSLKDHEQSFVKFLVDNGASLDTLNGDGKTPLEIACIYQGSSMATMSRSTGLIHNTACLLRSGADPNIRTSESVSVLEAVLRNTVRPAAIVELLLKHGADPETLTSAGDRVLHHACKMLSPSLVSALLRGGADVQAHDSKGLTPIRIAMRASRGTSREAVVIHLLSAGANPDDRDERGRTALHLACASKDSFLVRQLLDARADISARDGDGKTPLHYAIASQAVRSWTDKPWVEKTVRLLIWRGASMAARTADGLTALDLARQKGSGWNERDLWLLPSSGRWRGERLMNPLAWHT